MKSTWRLRTTLRLGADHAPRRSEGCYLVSSLRMGITSSLIDRLMKQRLGRILLGALAWTAIGCVFALPGVSMGNRYRLQSPERRGAAGTGLGSDSLLARRKTGGQDFCSRETPTSASQVCNGRSSFGPYCGWGRRGFGCS